jgi:hypothetical protein
MTCGWVSNGMLFKCKGTYLAFPKWTSRSGSNSWNRMVRTCVAATHEMLPILPNPPIANTDSALLPVRQRDPEDLLPVSALEQKIGFTMRSTDSLDQIVDAAKSVLEAQSAQTCLPF